MQYTSNYHMSKPEGSDVINPNSRAGYNDNFDTLDTNLKSVSDKANANEGNITTLQGDVADLNAKTGDDIPFESGSADSISNKITTLDNSVGEKPSGETDTLWDKVEDLSTIEAITDESQVFSSIPSGKTISSFSLLKVGKVAQINFSCAFSPASATNQWVTFATLNSEYSPFGRFDTFTINNNTDAPVHTRFNTNGDLQIWTSSAITTLVVSVVYILS